MYDVLTTAAIVSEFRETLLDGRIQKLGMVDPLTVAAEVYGQRQRRALVASADASDARLYQAGSLPSFDSSVVTPFSLQLRKYVRGGFVIGIEQPPLERVVEFTIARRMPDAAARRGAVEEDDEGDDGADQDPEDIWSGPDIVRVKLVVEIMGRHSNLILVGEDGVIMESAKRVTPSMSRVRPVLPKLPYVPPPAPDKLDPRRLTGPGAQLMISDADECAKLHQVLVRSLRGVSPQIGREIAWSVTGNGNATISNIGDADAQEVARQVRRVFEPLVMGSWTPTVYRQNDTVLDYSAVVFDHMAQDADVDHPESISAAIETGLETSSQAAPQDHDQLRQRLVQRIDVAQQKLGDRLRSLREQQRRAEEADSLRHAGETIYAWMWMIEPGQTVLNAEGESPIELDPALSANENAQAYFDRYRRAQRGLEQVPSRIRAAERERSYLEQLLTQVQQSQGFDALETLSQELDEYLDAHPGGRKPDQRNSKPGKRKPKSGKGSAPSQFRTPEGHTIHVGRSGKQNDQVTFSVGGPDDTWLHARGVAGSHVIVKWDTSVEEEDPATIEAAAALAAWYSSARQSGSVDVDVAKRRHVRKISGAGPGMVTYRNERTIVVAPQDEAALQEAGKLPS